MAHFLISHSKRQFRPASDVTVTTNSPGSQRQKSLIICTDTTEALYKLCNNNLLARCGLPYMTTETQMQCYPAACERANLLTGYLYFTLQEQKISFDHMPFMTTAITHPNSHLMSTEIRASNLQKSCFINSKSLHTRVRKTGNNNRIYKLN